jgi:hypothetical protein
MDSLRTRARPLLARRGGGVLCRRAGTAQGQETDFDMTLLPLLPPEAAYVSVYCNLHHGTACRAMECFLCAFAQGS